MDSIIQRERECYICGTTNNLTEHHLISGTSNRALSEQYGLKVCLCMKHHEEAHQDRSIGLMFKRLGQMHFERFHTREDFIKTFGKSFMEDVVNE